MKDKIVDSKVAAAFEAMPEDTRRGLLFLRQLILKTAADDETTGVLEETLKWGEPAYLCRSGSTIRLGYSVSVPHQYGLYFNCRSRLVETFREVYTEEFKFAGNRAIVFYLDDKIPVEELSHCIRVALCYHRCKNLPLLGM